MNAPQSHLQTELDHALGESLLADAMLQWRPSSRTLQNNLLEETLSHARAVSNVLANILEHRAVGIEDGAVINDICDAWDTYGLADLLSSLLEITTIVSRQTCPEHTDAPEPTTTCVWVAGGNGQEVCVDAQAKDWPAPAMALNGRIRHE
jgi:hypothetical protein